MSEQCSVKATIEFIAKVEDANLYGEFRDQIQKDIYRAGIDYTLQKSLVLSDLIQEFSELIRDLIAYKFNEFLNLLYVVDISENKVKGMIANSSNDMSDDIGVLILQRELQKVYFRNRR